MTNSLEFDTGLSARAFAQSKFAQFITEPGLIVRPTSPRRVELWKASGVREKTDSDGKSTIVIWGPPVEGERLDSLLEAPLLEAPLLEAPLLDQSTDKALAAISLWIQAVLILREDTLRGGEGGPPVEGIPLWPSAAIIAQGDNNRPPSVFFAPPALIKHRVTHNDEWYVNPALDGTASHGGAAAFTAAVMLYRLFAGTPPFSAADTSTLHEDMREGNFLPVHLAVPGLDSRLAALIHSALAERRALERRAANGVMPAPDGGLGELHAILPTGGQTAAAASLVKPLSEPDRLLLEKEKAQFLKIKTASVKTRRFAQRNTALLMGALAAAVAAAFMVYSVISSRASLPTTAGMGPVQVIERYYHGFGELDHQMMEACVTGGAGKNDITAVINFFVMSKTRQAYQFNAPPLVFPAHQWPGGDFPDIPLFGASDVRVALLAGDESGGNLRYRVDYTFWIPQQISAEEALSQDNTPPTGSDPYPRSDLLTLVRDKKGNWRITEITR